MNANELRIGNFIEKNGDACVLASINTDDTIRIFNDDRTDTFGCFCLRIFNPIPLNEEWLLKLGLKKTYSNGYGLNGEHEFDLLYNDVIGYRFSMEGQYGYPEIKYVHQLQNLYFALTNEELICKP